MKEVLPNPFRHDATPGRRRFPRDQYADVNSATLQDLAHDLRQPLGIIETLAYYLEMTTSDESTYVHLQRIRAMVAEANRILERTSAHAEELLLEASPC